MVIMVSICWYDVKLWVLTIKMVDTWWYNVANYLLIVIDCFFWCYAARLWLLADGTVVVIYTIALVYPNMVDWQLISDWVTAQRLIYCVVTNCEDTMWLFISPNSSSTKPDSQRINQMLPCCVCDARSCWWWRRFASGSSCCGGGGY